MAPSNSPTVVDENNSDQEFVEAFAETMAVEEEVGQTVAAGLAEDTPTEEGEVVDMVVVGWPSIGPPETDSVFNFYVIFIIELLLNMWNRGNWWDKYGRDGDDRRFLEEAVVSTISSLRGSNNENDGQTPLRQTENARELQYYYPRYPGCFSCFISYGYYCKKTVAPR